MEKAAELAYMKMVAATYRAAKPASNHFMPHGIMPHKLFEAKMLDARITPDTISNRYVRVQNRMIRQIF